VLDYSIRASSTLSYHLSFMVELVYEVPSSMIPEPRYWVEFSLTMQFYVACISSSLASIGPAGTTASEQV
jgi:hypothetical protein